MKLSIPIFGYEISTVVTLIDDGICYLKLIPVRLKGFILSISVKKPRTICKD